MAVGHAAEIAGITYESEVADAGLLGPYALSALAFRNAQLERGKVSDPKIVEYFLAEAIRHAPEEAVPYYFRAFWRHMWEIQSQTSNTEIPKGDLAAWVADLELASRLSPSWEEPKKELRSLQSPRNSLQ